MFTSQINVPFVKALSNMLVKFEVVEIVEIDELRVQSPDPFTKI